jgi:two-component system sensor histidine kinase RpfC
MPAFLAELRADLMTRWLTRAGWKTMLAAAPKPELEQVVLRIAVPLIATLWLCGDFALHGHLDSGKAHGLIFAVAFLAFAVGMLLLLLCTAQQGRIVVVRRVIGMIADNAANSYFMFVVGEGGAIVFGVYLFVTFGNGFRYGRKYLHVSQALSLLGFGIVLLVSPFWSQHPWIGAGMMLAMLVLPFYVGVLAQRITEAKLRADEANAAKGRFLANVSHEMRTPLNGVIAMSDLLRETSMSESQREIVETLSTSAQLALAQIEDVLDMGKIEAGRIEIRAQPFMLGKLLTDIVKVVLPQARYKGLTVTTEIDPATSGGFIGDPHHLRQVLLNLLSNAVKFTESGTVTLRAHLRDRANNVGIVRIEVEDTGIGIPPEKQAKIFDPFTQADDSITRVYGGTGLGTTIARQLAGLMGGEIGVTSTPGEGSLFWVELPLPVAPPESKFTEELANAVAVATRNAPAPATQVVGTAAGAKVHKIRGARVLVAEDNPTNQRVTQLVLESGGHVPVIVGNGDEALDALEEGGFDIALFDLSMPVVSGLEALKLYRFAAEAPIPVLILSANVTAEIIGECMAAGAAEFVAKPVRASVLLDAIDRHLADGASTRVQGGVPQRAEERPALTVVDTPPLEARVVAELAGLSKDPTFVERLVRGFRSDCERLIGDIASGLASRNYEAVKDAAHALKGGAGSVGAALLVQFAVRLEKSSHETLRLRASALSEEGRSLADRTFAALDAHLATREARPRSSTP